MIEFKRSSILSDNAIKSTISKKSTLTKVGKYYFSDNHKIVSCYETSDEYGYDTLENCNEAKDHYSKQQTKAKLSKIPYYVIIAASGYAGYKLTPSPFGLVGIIPGAILGFIVAVIIDVKINGIH